MCAGNETCVHKATVDTLLHTSHDLANGAYSSPSKRRAQRPPTTTRPIQHSRPNACQTAHQQHATTRGRHSQTPEACCARKHTESHRPARVDATNAARLCAPPRCVTTSLPLLYRTAGKLERLNPSLSSRPFLAQAALQTSAPPLPRWLVASPPHPHRHSCPSSRPRS